MGNADVVLHVEAVKAAGAIKVNVEKMRDGRDGFSIYFKVPPAGSATVPVPEKITEATGIFGWTLHDLRRTAKTLMVRPGVRPDISELTLGHGIPGVAKAPVSQRRRGKANPELVLRRRHKIHPSRHGRACPGRPRLAAQTQPVSVDARHKAGYDDCSETAPSECA
jgi:hypothetical protein